MANFSQSIMNKFKTIKISLILAVFALEMAFPNQVKAAQLEVLPKDSQNDFSLMETAEGKLVYTTDSALKPHKVVRAILTAYSSTPDQTDSDPFTAASGKRVYDGMVAANWLPFGTKIKIPSLYGEKIFTVDDRMNARYGYGRMDIWMNGERKTINAFGVKKVDIEVYYTEKYAKVAKADNNI